MPKRFCQCRGCPSCNTTTGSHSALFDLDTTATLKCPACQAASDQRRNTRTSSASRGYGSKHRQVRERLLARWRPGDPCALCRKPMNSKRNLDLAHNADRTGYLGLAHAACNRATSTGK